MAKNKNDTTNAVSTPGPWKKTDGFPTVTSGTVPLVLAYPTAVKGQDEANALLIAAAPELLAALEEMVDTRCGKDVNAMLNQARAAIARARGTNNNQEEK